MSNEKSSAFHSSLLIKLRDEYSLTAAVKQVPNFDKIFPGYATDVQVIEVRTQFDRFYKHKIDPKLM